MRCLSLCVYYAVIVYNETTHHSYSHHEIMLNTYPLCLEWMDYNTAEPDKKGPVMCMTQQRAAEVNISWALLGSDCYIRVFRGYTDLFVEGLCPCKVGWALSPLASLSTATLCVCMCCIDPCTLCV